jgi:hypothetical protein
MLKIEKLYNLDSKVMHIFLRLVDKALCRNKQACEEYFSSDVRHITVQALIKKFPIYVPA